MAIGLYIHVPFCVKKCQYCDFVSYSYDEGLAASYVSALIKEIELYGSLLEKDKKRLTSLYIGGGTPSLLSSGQVESVFGAVHKVFEYGPETEITTEVNPGTVSLEKLQTLRNLGCNRLSIGMQSANPRLLNCMGRIHTVEEAEQAYGLARKAGFDNVNIDVIFGIPGQSLEDWAETLNWVTSLSPEHISAYSLKIEEGTPFARMAAGGELALVDEETDLAMFLYTIDFLKADGYEHYEISNYCLPGRESVHNLRYWLNEEYVGMGPAAHSYLNKWRYHNYSRLDEYFKFLRGGELPIQERIETVSGDEISETIFLALRTMKGLDLAGFQKRFGKTVEELFPLSLDKLEKLGLVVRQEGFLRLTRKGLPLANEVFAEFI